MNKKDYELLAAVMAAERPNVTIERYHDTSSWQRGTYDEWNAIVIALCKMLKAENEAFDVGMFTKACEE